MCVSPMRLFVSDLVAVLIATLMCRQSFRQLKLPGPMPFIQVMASFLKVRTWPKCARLVTFVLLVQTRMLFA